MDSAATLDVSGRDQQDQRLHLERDSERLLWQLERTETEPHKEPSRSCSGGGDKTGDRGNIEWNGTATELANLIPSDFSANGLSMRLNVRAGRLPEEYRIRYEPIQTHDSRRIKLALLSTEA